MTTLEVLKHLANAADDVLVDVHDRQIHLDEETGLEHPEYRRLRVMERLARRALRNAKGNDS